MNHLYIQTAFLGDLLLSVPTLRQIRYLDPSAHLTLLCRKGYGETIRRLGLVDSVVEMDKKAKLESISELKQKSYDWIFCPHQSMTSHKIVKALDAKKKIGYYRSWNHSYFTDRIKRRLDWPEAIRQLQLLAPVSEDIAIKLEAFAQRPETIPNWATMHLPSLSWSESEVTKLLQQKSANLNVTKPYVCLAPGSVWPTKRWTVDGYKRLAIQLVRNDYQVVLLGAPDERDLCEGLHVEIPNSHSLAGQLSIYQSLQVLSRASAVVCNDSGAMHMASLLNLPTFSVFGPTVQSLGYLPWNPNAEVFEVEDLLCRPCGQHGTRECPIGTHRCMTDVSSEAILDRLLTVLN